MDMIGLGHPEYIFRILFVLGLVESPLLDLWSIYHKISVGDPTTMAAPARKDAHTLGDVAARVWWVEDIGRP